ncbi:transcriptional regulator LuxZ [Vibrio ponticus]|nr:transcriptional regulator LuxZ [Vibrio ponticus]
MLKQAINHGDESWELELLTAYHKLSRLKTMQEEYDWIEWQERQRHFHECLLNAATSKIMLSFFADLLNQVQRYRFMPSIVACTFMLLMSTNMNRS